MGFEATNILIYIMASLVLIITPGPDMIYIVIRGISQGRVAGVMSAFGVCCGILVHTLAVALGLALLLKTSAFAYNAIKYTGAIYLIYLGVSNLLKQKDFKSLPGNQKKSHYKLLLQGFLTDVFNPKVALFFISFLPQFVNQESTLVTLQTVTLGLIYFILSLAVLIVLALFSAKIGNLLLNNSNIGKRINQASGGMLIGLGLYLAIPDKKPDF